MADSTLEVRYPWLSTYVQSETSISVPTHVREADKSSGLWVIQIPFEVNMEKLQSSKWKNTTSQGACTSWYTKVDGTTYILEEVVQNSPCYTVDQETEESPSMTQVVKYMVVYPSESNHHSHDREEQENSKHGNK